MNVAIFGYGTIGSGVYEIITDHKSEALKEIQVTRILDLPQNKDKLAIITDDINEILNDESIELVVETMGGLHPAYEFIMSSLQHGKHVVSANKAVVAAYLEEFLQTAKEHNVKFLFEASTGGGIPWLASILKAKRIDKIDSFYGIFNGTSNFILDHMYHYNKDFHESLKLAQELGYAEANPSADIDGYDVTNKVVISAALAFDAYIDRKQFPCFSMSKISFDDIHYLKENNKTVKYIGEAQILDGCYEAFVMPNVFPSSSLEANVRTNFNIATLHGETIGELKFFGQGAGKLPTANAIIQDILDIRMMQNEYDTNRNEWYAYSDTLLANRYLIRSHQSHASALIEKTEEYNGNYYMYTSSITTKDMMELYHSIMENDENTFIAKIGNFE